MQCCMQDLLRDVRTCLESCKGQTLSVTAIVDIMNLIGRCVVAGNVRRTAEIGMGITRARVCVTVCVCKEKPCCYPTVSIFVI